MTQKLAKSTFDKLCDQYRRNKTLRDRSYVVRAMDRYLELCDGPEAIGEFWKDTMQAALETKSVMAKINFVKATQEMLRDYDQISEKSMDWDNVDPEDLKSVVLGTVMERIREDPEYAKAILLEAVNEDPRLVTAMMTTLKDFKESGTLPEREAIEHLGDREEP